MSDAALTPALSATGMRPVPAARASDAAPSAIALLTRRLAAGEEAAFREFHALYFDRLYRFLLVVTRGEAHVAQDALQETLLRVVRHAREFESEEFFWSWLKAIARNAARDAGRKRRRYLAVLEKFAFWRSPPNGVSDQAGEEAALRGFIEEGLAELAPDDRQLVEGKYLRGATVAELATDTGLTVKAVESRLVRVRRQLAETLIEKLRRR